MSDQHAASPSIWISPDGKQALASSSALPKDHRPLRIGVDGLDVTREACILQLQLGKEYVDRALPEPYRESFMIEMLAGANHDMLILGYPMISLDDVSSAESPLAKLVTPERVAQLSKVMRESLRKWDGYDV